MNAIAWAANGQTGGAGGMIGSLMPLVLIFVIFYFLLILPQRKKQKEHRQMVESLKKGDKIITTGGIYGTVTNVKKNYLEIEVEDKVKLRVQRGAVTRLRGEE
ncbi:preprotein translocase subunit YajC [Candidatus Aerophobetes bacterium]|nr:preprotein translocase subunit YajC [Candidatus Aerophobetes bacterium]